MARRGRIPKPLVASPEAVTVTPVLQRSLQAYIAFWKSLGIDPSPRQVTMLAVVLSKSLSQRASVGSPRSARTVKITTRAGTSRMRGSRPSLTIIDQPQELHHD